MKILNFLIFSDFHALARDVVDYLIDAGHFVAVHSTRVEDLELWRKRYTHNFNLADSCHLDWKAFDYLIDFHQSIVRLDIDSIQFYIECAATEYQIVILLLKNGNTAVLRKCTGQWVHSLDIQSSRLERLLKEVSEAVIDAVIQLSRFGSEELLFDNRIQNNPVIYELIQDANRLARLEHYYRSLEKESQVFANPTLGFTNQNSQAVSHTYQVHLLERNLDQTALEIFGLYCLTLLNGRQEALYGYDCYSAGKQISKFVRIHLSDTYRALQAKCQDSLYAVISSPFYDPLPLPAGASKPEVAVFYNEPIPDGGQHAVSIAYRAQNQALQIRYRKDLYLFGYFSEHLQHFLNHFPSFLSESIPFRAMLDIPPAQRQQCLFDWNRTERGFQEDKSLHELIELQAARTPDSPAVIYNSAILSYQQLNARANQLARYLIQNHPIQPETPIGLYLDRNERMLIALLGILKAGAAYLPLDIRHPAYKIAGILKDSGASLVLSTRQCRVLWEAHLQSLSKDSVCHAFGAKTAWILLDEEGIQQSLNQASDLNLNLPVTSRHWVYVLYTSGTTGDPKGVVVEHQALINILESIREKIDFSEKDCLLSVTTLAFDIAALELWMPLMQGGRVVIATQQEVLKPARLLALIEQWRVTVMQATPSLWSLVMQEGVENLSINALCGGEPLSLALARTLFKTVDHCWNVYGPTETTVWSSCQEIKKDYWAGAIGTPIANTTAYILDSHLNPLPIGAPGEIHIGGIGLARGYLNQPELTKARFIPNPFQTEKEKQQGQNARLYKTGDLGRWLPEGNIEFLGRNDFQVKLRGHRIELGEIEHTLSTYEGVQNSVVLLKTPQAENRMAPPYLIGYYVSPEPLDETRLFAHLKARLPETMIPSRLVQLARLPLTPNGKLDRQALPDPGFVGDRTRQVAPRTELEKQLCALWGEVLNTPAAREDIRADFFHLGGNSILAIQLLNKINSALQVDIKISDIFEQRTVEHLAPLAAASLGSFRYQSYLIQQPDQSRLFKPFPLNNVQQSYYLGRLNHFELSHVSTHVYAEYQYAALDIGRLEQAFNCLIERHMALRTVFVNGRQQHIKSVPHYTIKVHELSCEQELLAIRDQLSHKIYTPDQYPLFDVVVSKWNGQILIHLSFDALIVDLGSFQILFDEWAKLYKNPEALLPVLEISYRDYVLHYEKIRVSALFQEAERYWRGRLRDYHFEMNLPLKIQPFAVRYPRFARVSRVLSKPIWEALLSKAQQAHISPTALVLAAYGSVLSRWSGQDKLCVNLTLFNRLPLHPQIENLIGDFTVLELFSYQDREGDAVHQKLRTIHDVLMKDIEHNLFDGVDVQRLVKKEQSMPDKQILAPVVLTSVLGNIQSHWFDWPLDDSYQGVRYAISQTSQVWLDNKAYETDKGFIAEWDYVEQLFDRSLIEAMHYAYCELLERLAQLDWETSAFPKIPLPLPEQALIAAANCHTQPLSSDTLHSRYEKVLTDEALQRHIAIIDAATEQTYTHGTLQQDSTQLAQTLSDQNSPSTSQALLVGVLSEKGYNQVLAALAILKSGHAYLPLSIDWPVGRLDEVLAQGYVQVVLISQAQYDREAIRNALSQKYTLKIIEALRTTSDPSASALPKVEADDIAYVIFTSGSTGKPKGVTISHRSALNTIDAVNRRFEIAKQDKILALSELSFDLSVYDLFGLLTAGGTIVFPEQSRSKDPVHWVSLIQQHQITLWNSVPQLAALLLDAVTQSPVTKQAAIPLASLRLFLLSGDWIPSNLPIRLKVQCPRAVLMSLGGATEGSIWSVWYEIDPEKSEDRIPYGVSMPNQKLFVLNPSGEHCPVGVQGEIHIGGLGLARDYWDAPDLTEARFISHPQLGRLYKTGDLGRWLPEGKIEFLGRNDFQVKLNGYRVELEEIAARLSQLEGVKEAVVRIQKEDERDYVVAYLLPEDTKTQLEASFDKESFVLDERGLIQGLKAQHVFEPNLEPSAFKRRKSYRNFTESEVGIGRVAELSRLFMAQWPPRFDAPYEPKTLSTETLGAVLAGVSGLRFKGRALPKYLYPSGGSTYSVRCFLDLATPVDTLEADYYYYHPTDYSLCRFHAPWCIGQAEKQRDHALHLIAHWPAITPLYGKVARRLVYLEAGHMLSALSEVLTQHGLAHEWQVTEEPLDADNTLLAILSIGSDSICWPECRLKPGFLMKQGSGRVYVDLEDHAILDLDKQSVLLQASEVGELLARGQLLITLNGEASLPNLVLAGFMAQRISTALYPYSIGSCTIGWVPYPAAVYTLVLGHITEDEKRKVGSCMQAPSLQEVANLCLSKHLPEYMLPHAYRQVDLWPVSANGKLDAGRLPKLQLQKPYVAPANPVERQLSQIWSEVLGIPESQISMQDNFFVLGGNSLLAMQAVRRLSHDLGLDLALQDFYQTPSIRSIAHRFRSKAAPMVMREEGVL